MREGIIRSAARTEETDLLIAAMQMQCSLVESKINQNFRIRKKQQRAVVSSSVAGLDGRTIEYEFEVIVEMQFWFFNSMCVFICRLVAPAVDYVPPTRAHRVLSS